MSKVSKILRITMGLPGSGKTDFATKKVKEGNGYGYNSQRKVHIDFDLFTKRNISLDRIKTELNDYVKKDYFNEIIVDGLFLTIDDVIKLIELIDKKYYTELTDVCIEYWRENIEYCLHNDMYRRDGNDSSITIKNGKLERVTNSSIKTIEDHFPLLVNKVKINYHNVIKIPEWKVFANKYSLHYDDDGKVKGSSWCLGGTWANCWGNSGSVSSEPEPDGFDELDKILEDISPNITFLQYKRIVSNVVLTDEYGDSDYYGGRTLYAYRYFYVESLYNELKERELI